MKVLAVGDIHTKTYVIDLAMSLVDNYNAVVFVGDYADDWGKEPVDTINTLKRLKELQEAHPSKVKIVIGNHDFIYVNRTNTISSGYNVGTQFMLDLPDNKELKAWVAQLPISVELDGVTYSHAGFTPDWEPKSGYWNDQSPIWARPIDPNFSSRRQYFPNQVFGHTPGETCREVEPNVWCIDTFSTHHDGTPIGDGSVLEITNGTEFTKQILSEIKPV